MNGNPVNYTDPLGLVAAGPSIFSAGYPTSGANPFASATPSGQSLVVLAANGTGTTTDIPTDTPWDYIPVIGAGAKLGGLAVGAVTKLFTKEAETALPAALRGGEATVDVYNGVRNGEKVYVGITNDVARRQAEHGTRFKVEPMTTAPVTRGEARAIEQAVKVQNPGFENIRNSISPKHSWYDDAVNWGRQWLKDNGILK